MFYVVGQLVTNDALCTQLLAKYGCHLYRVHKWLDKCAEILTDDNILQLIEIFRSHFYILRAA